MSDSVGRRSNDFPVDPLSEGSGTINSEYRRRAIAGILESYNSNYDVLSEAVQNAVDAVEDAVLREEKPPYSVSVTVNLRENWIGVLDTGVGMVRQQVRMALAPHVTFKNDPELLKKRTTKNAYRGYKGVGLTFLAYGSDDIAFHSKKDGETTKARMQYGRAWAAGTREDAALLVEDARSSPIDNVGRGTYIQIQFSEHTLPRSLPHLGGTAAIWIALLRTKTAIGQILLGRGSVADFTVTLKVITSDGKEETQEVAPQFLYPHTIPRNPPFRFLDLADYYTKHPEQAEPASDYIRQDGMYLVWDTDRLRKEMTSDQQKAFDNELKQYTPYLYAFLPYQGSVWADINQQSTGVRNRNYLYPGLILAVNRQRLADTFEFAPTRFETFSRNALIVVHFDEAKPDQGRKTVQEKVLELAQRAADRAVQYLAKQRAFLRPVGESPTPDQRQLEKDHQDWTFNVRTHANNSPLLIPPVTYISTPQVEQDVVGLFHQLTAIGVFPGIKVYATSQIKTYDCLIEYEVGSDAPGMRYVAAHDNPLGVSPFVLGDRPKFETGILTVEFKNNLDGLIDDLDSDSPKKFANIDICVCWGTVGTSFKGYQVEEIIEANLDERRYPGITHLLRKDGESHVVQVTMLERVIGMISSGNLKLSP